MAEDTTVEDVNTVAEDTAGDSSIPEQTDQSNVNADTSNAGTPNDPGPIPYTRFQEVNEKNKELTETVEQIQAEMERLKSQTPPPPAPAIDPQALEVKQQLAQLGFMTREQYQTETMRQKEDMKVGQEIDRLSKTFNGSDGRPKFNKKEILDFAVKQGFTKPEHLELAYKQKYEKELLDWHIKNATLKSKGIKTESSDGSGSSNAGTTNTDLREQIAKGDKGALHTLIKRQFTFK